MKTTAKACHCLAVLLLAAGLTTNASAANVTLNEAGLDAIFSQTNFGLNTIDIRFNPIQTIYNSALLSIDSAAEFNLLATYETGSPTVSMFYVDAINFCGVAAPNVVGCGSTPGTLIALDSGFTAGGQGANLMAHELGHNLSLGHVNPDNGTNLMNPTITNSSNLTPAQVATILLSGLVQTGRGGQRFIQITPFLVADDVPEPSTLVLAGFALGIVAWTTKRARKV